MIVGTAGYMAPEQVRGLDADHRADIFSFGVVFFEMLCGDRAFKGDTAVETMTAILTHDPVEPSSLARALPPDVQRILRHCLEKLPDERFQSARDLAFNLESISGVSEAAAPVRRKVARMTIAIGAVCGLIAGGLLAGAGMRFLTPAAPSGVTRFTIALPPQVQFRESMALSPDGRTLVYSASDPAGTRLYRRSLDTLESVPIRGTEGGTLPFFSPDGASIGFIGEGAIKWVPLQGGAAITITQMSGGGGAAAWLPDDTIVIGPEGQGLMRVPLSGGPARELTVLDQARGELGHRWPIAVPGDRAVAFTIHYGARDTQRVDAVSLDSGKRVTLVEGNGARFLPTGHILFQRLGDLWVAAFDSTRLAVTGTPTAVVEGVGIALDWSPKIAAGRNGSLAYATGGEPYPPRTLVWVDKAGHETVIDAPQKNWWWPQVSPDGRRLGFHIMDPVNMDAWIYELDHGPLVKVTYHPHQDGYPLWSPDGKHIVFWSRQGGGPGDLYLRSADLAGHDKRITTSKSFTYYTPSSWADGGKLLVFQQTSAETRADIGVIPIDGDAAPKLLIQSPADEAHPAVSPDGRWIAYQSNVSGRWEVYVQPFPDLSGRWQVSTQGGVSPLWSPDGRELFYRHERAVIGVPVTPGTAFRYGNPRVLFEGAYVREQFGPGSSRSYALATDGQRFLMMKEDPPPPTQIIVIANWAEELARLTGQR